MTWYRRVCTVAILAVLTATMFGGSASAGRAPARRGAACLPGAWKLDLQSLVASASITRRLTATGSVDLTFRRGTFLQTYADIISGTTARGSVEQKYAGAVGGRYRATARKITLSNIDNATEMVMTVSVNGISAAPTRQAPAPGTTAARVDLAYTCNGNALTISSGGTVAQHYTRTG